MKVIVHIGTEKTGTTSIQEFLYQNRNRLIKSGYYFVQSPGKKNNRVLPAYCMSDEKYDDFYEQHGITNLAEKNEFKRDFLSRFQTELKWIPRTVHTAIISSEHFHSRIKTLEEVTSVRRFLASFSSDFKIVCYLRDQLTMCASFYSTAIKTGLSPSFDKFVRACKSDNTYYNYYEMLLKWEKVFGSDSMDLSIFDPDSLLNSDLLDDFTAKIDPALVGQLDKDISVENESLNYSGQVLGKIVNDIYRQSSQSAEDKTRHRECHRIIYENCKGEGEQASASAQKQIYAEFDESNENLRERFFPDRDALFSRQTKELATDKTIDDGFVEVLASVLSVMVDGRTTKRIPSDLNVGLPDRYADILRNSALKIENIDLKLGFELMKLAQLIRPGGPFINRKVEEYRRRISEVGNDDGLTN